MKLEMPSSELLKWLVATLAIPVTMSYLGYTYQQTNSHQQSLEARLRLYTELLSSREQADTALRKDMFTKVLETFLKPDHDDIGGSIDALELLTLNFNDTLNLSPLFHQLDRRIDKGEEAERVPLGSQLMRIAKLVKERQSDVLATAGTRRTARIDLAGLSAATQPIVSEPLAFDVQESANHVQHYSRQFLVEALDHDASHKRVLLRVSFDNQQISFWLDPFDFPAVNFSRLSSDERMAVVMTDYKEATAKIDFLYFPSSRSGISDKPYIDEVVTNLMKEHQ